MSAKLVIALTVVYVVIAIVCLFEKKFPFALYWLGATLIQISLLWGFK
jgi:uncharacterized membrane protein